MHVQHSRDFVSHVREQLAALAGPGTDSRFCGCGSLACDKLAKLFFTTDDALSDDAIDGFANPVLLPPPELGNLPDVEQIMRAASSTPSGRDSLTKFILN